MPPPHFSIRQLDSQQVPDGYHFVVTTDTPCHLWLRWTLEKPRTHKDPLLRRGAYFPEKVRFCFVEYLDNEQQEAGDTLTHTFLKQEWPVCQIRYFYFWGTVAGEASPSESPLFEKHFTGVGNFVKSLGKLTEESEVLIGDVKLKEGAGVTITRVDEDNALEISAEAAEYEGFADKYTITKTPADMLDHPFFRSDEIVFSIVGTNHKIIVESGEMYTWETWQSLSLYFCCGKGARLPTNMLAFFGMNRGDPDILSHPENASIGVYLANYRWHAQNGDGVNFTRTALDTYSPAHPMPFKIVRSASDIKWYRNGVLKATRGSIVCQRIKYFSGIFP